MVYFQHFLTLFLGKTKEILAQLNWVDIVGIIVVIRTFYIGIRQGLLIEIFKVTGFGIGLFMAVTQYRNWGAVIAEKSVLSPWQAEVVTFGVIFVVGYGLFFLLRLFVMKMMTLQIRGAWDRIGGGMVGLARGCLVMIFLEVTALCLAAPAGYLSQSIRERSFFGPSLLTGGKVTYQVANHVSSSFTIEKVEAILEHDFPPPASQKK